MKRVLIALITALPLAVGVAAAQADGGPGGPGAPWMTAQAAVAGTVISTNTTNGTFMANAYVLTPPSMGGGGSDGGGSGGPSGGGSGGLGSGFGGGFASHSIPTPTTPTTPTTTQVTITTNASTMIRVSGVDGPATVADLAPGDRFLALFPGASTDTIQTLVMSPATSVFAQVPKQFYAFVGTVGKTDTTADTMTVNVMRSLPSSLIASGTTATFTLSPHTFIIGGSSLSTTTSSNPFGGLFGGSITAIAPGDMVAGGLIGDAGLTAAQFEAGPLMFVLDLPAPATTPGAGATTPTATSAANQALKETLKLLHGGKVKLTKSHHGKSHHGSKKAKHAGRR